MHGLLNLIILSYDRSVELKFRVNRVRMHVSISVLSERQSERDTIPLEVTPYDKIESVKAQIEQIQQSLLPCKQLLVYAGQQLENGHTLEEYGVEDCSTVFLVFKPNGEEQ